MSEDRTQAPSKRRREMARERGQVAQSAELTGAVGLLAASAALTIWGDGLAASLVAIVREPLLTSPPVSADVAEVVAQLRHLAIGVAWPLLLVMGTCASAALAAHQFQVLGLWAPGLLAPDPARLWTPGTGPGLADRVTRGLWALAKTVVVAAVAAWVIRSEWSAFERLGALKAPDLARVAGQAMRHLALALALATLALGFVDFGLQYARFEAMLRLTPDEHREELRSVEGDPAIRAHRRRLARSWRVDRAEPLIGSTLILTGPSGLTVVLAGGPPPRHASVRSIATGAAGSSLRRAAESAAHPRVVDAPDLARRLAHRRAPGLPPTAALLDELALLWPAVGTDV
jgi:flagellar biosynthesis protein FlhB